MFCFLLQTMRSYMQTCFIVWIASVIIFTTIVLSYFTHRNDHLSHKDKMLEMIERCGFSMSNYAHSAKLKFNFTSCQNETDLLCFLKSTMLRWLHSDMYALPLQQYNRCAVISSAGSMLNSNLGDWIDSHDAIIRFNDAPVAEYEKDVGSRTDIRFINEQVLLRDTFVNDNIFRNVNLVLSYKSEYYEPESEWLKKESTQKVFNRYFEMRKKRNMYFLHPDYLWNIWDILQSSIKFKIRANPPSTGFIGIAVMMHYCKVLEVVEFIPSVRWDARCHYYQERQKLCGFDPWHPICVEKKVLLNLNVASDNETFLDGVVRINC